MPPNGLFLNSKFAEEIDRLRPFEPKISYEYIDGKIVDAPELATTVVSFFSKSIYGKMLT